MRHDLLLDLLEQMGASSQSRAVVKDYLRLPDRQQSSRGMSVEGSLSPLLAAVMLPPLDASMHRLLRLNGLFYVRYMDDFVIMAQKRHQLRRAIKCVHEVLESERNLKVGPFRMLVF